MASRIFVSGFVILVSVVVLLLVAILVLPFTPPDGFLRQQLQAIGGRRLQVMTQDGGDTDKPIDCIHGKYISTNKSCSCDPGWARAGVTDTLHFLEGVCEQYHCKNAATCVEALKVTGATCPVRGWNCYCGWWYAFSDWGQGYETSEGKCMGLMYTFSISISILLKKFMLHAYKVILPLAVMLLPFGRKRANCDHHRPSLWLGVRKCFGVPSSCRGECVMSASYSADTFMDDIAWTIYALDVGFWLYLFMFTLWVVAESIWSILLWLAVMLIIICSALVACLMACGEGMGDCLACNSCDSCGAAGGMDCMDCCGVCAMHGGHSAGIATGPADAFYWSGTFPYDPFWGYGGYGSYDFNPPRAGECSFGSCCTFFCRPIAWLLFVFPVMPENVWGGFAGYFFFGTHQWTPVDRLYQGGNSFIEFLNMGWRRRADLHDAEGWRLQVRTFLTPGDEENQNAVGGQGVFASASDRRVNDQMVSEVQHLTMQDGAPCRMIQIGRAHAVLIDTPFDKETHSCVQSSFEDYKNNECWICTQDGEEWDMWLSCKHLFCKACSTEMLKRRMPCPLCRVSSSTVLRGKCWTLDPYREGQRKEAEAALRMAFIDGRIEPIQEALEAARKAGVDSAKIKEHEAKFSELAQAHGALRAAIQAKNIDEIRQALEAARKVGLQGASIKEGEALIEADKAQAGLQWAIVQQNIEEIKIALDAARKKGVPAAKIKIAEDLVQKLQAEEALRKAIKTESIDEIDKALESAKIVGFEGATKEEAIAKIIALKKPDVPLIDLDSPQKEVKDDWCRDQDKVPPHAVPAPAPPDQPQQVRKQTEEPQPSQVVPPINTPDLLQIDPALEVVPEIVTAEVPQSDPALEEERRRAEEEEKKKEAERARDLERQAAEMRLEAERKALERRRPKDPSPKKVNEPEDVDKVEAIEKPTIEKPAAWNLQPSVATWLIVLPQDSQCSAVDDSGGQAAAAQQVEDTGHLTVMSPPRSTRPWNHLPSVGAWLLPLPIIPQ